MSINYEQMFKDAVIRACNADGILSLENSEPIATIGICYMNGYGTEKNDKKAFNFLSMAVDLGNVEAMSSLAKCYIYGIGTAKDSDESFYYVKKAVEMGSVPALSSLADFYEYGFGTVQNLEKAEKLRAEYNEKIKNM